MTPHRFRKLKRAAQETFHSEEGSVRLVQTVHGVIKAVWDPSEAENIPPGTTVTVQQTPMMWAIANDDELEQVDTDDMGKRGDFIAHVPNAAGLLDTWLILSKAEAITTAKTWDIR